MFVQRPCLAVGRCRGALQRSVGILAVDCGPPTSVEIRFDVGASLIGVLGASPLVLARDSAVVGPVATRSIPFLSCFIPPPSGVSTRRTGREGLRAT